MDCRAYGYRMQVGTHNLLPDARPMLYGVIGIMGKIYLVIGIPPRSLLVLASSIYNHVSTERG
jgi:hypothetical protein